MTRVSLVVNKNCWAFLAMATCLKTISASGEARHFDSLLPVFGTCVSLCYRSLLSLMVTTARTVNSKEDIVFNNGPRMTSLQVLTNNADNQIYYF